MKKAALIILLTICYLYSNSQSNDDITARFSAGIYGSTPIYLTGTDRFFNDNWVLKNGTGTIAQKREYYKYGYGIIMQYSINQHLALKGIFGLSRRDLKECYYHEGTFAQEVLSRESRSFDYHQTSLSALIGLNYAFRKNRFVLNSGFELSYLKTGKGKQTHDDWTSMSGPTWGLDSTHIVSDASISGGNSYGLGIYMGTEYLLTRHLSIGLEFHQFAFYSVFNNETTEYVQDYYISYVTPDNIIAETNTQTHTSDPENLRQFCFSTVTPMITLCYHFNRKE